MAAFRFRIPGQPPSWNASFRIVQSRKSGRMTLAKTYEASSYQTMLVAPIARRSRPRDWEIKAKRWIRVRYWFHFDNAMDPDNALKIVNDGIAAGLERNDRWFLPCVEAVTWGNREPYTEIEIEEL